jgi:hypothetical protein
MLRRHRIEIAATVTAGLVGVVPIALALWLSRVTTLENG